MNLCSPSMNVCSCTVNLCSSRKGNYITIEHLCRLFYSDLFATIHIQSFADGKTDGATYLNNLFSKYDMLPVMDHVLVYIQRGSERNNMQDDNTVSGILSPEEKELFETISKRVCCNEYKKTVIVFVSPNDTLLTIVGYNSDKPLTYDIIDD